MHVEVNWNVCESNALCVMAAPEVFELQDDDRLLVLDENPDASLREAVEKAARVCPKRAISISD